MAKKGDVCGGCMGKGTYQLLGPVLTCDECAGSGRKSASYPVKKPATKSDGNDDVDLAGELGPPRRFTCMPPLRYVIDAATPDEAAVPQHQRKGPMGLPGH